MAPTVKQPPQRDSAITLLDISLSLAHKSPADGSYWVRALRESHELGLLPNACKVVKYLEPVMSQDLPRKFPDSSSLGFDYSYISIRAPLLPRSRFPVDSGSFTTPRKLCFGGFGQERTATRKKKKINMSMSNKKKKKSKKMSTKVSDSSLNPMNVGCAPFARKQMLNYFTCKAVRTVLNQLYEMNPTQYRWFYDFVAENKPGDGKRFIRILGKERHVLAERVMITSFHLYRKWIKGCSSGRNVIMPKCTKKSPTRTWS